ncbi:MAG: PKD domain-containing protein [Nitrososphaera sp.]
MVGAPIEAFADTPVAVMNIWSPHSATSTDGIPTSTFTFSADVTASDGILRVEWDFDGNGTVDGTTPISGAPNHLNGVSTTRVYGFEGIFWPQVRVVDVNSVMSAWDRYQVGGEDVPLDVFWPPPSITMLQWSPFVVTLGQPVTFSATAFNPVGVQLFEWDFNGDGSPDATSPAIPPGAQSASGSIVYTYTSAIATFPSVRALDNDDFLSQWDQYDIDGQPVQLVAGGSVPEVTMNQWSPYSASGPDGVPTTVFTFSASGTSDDGIARFEWDFNGDGNVDATTPVSGSPESATGTTTHTYGNVGTWVPKVRLVASNDIETDWTPYLISSSPVALDVGPPPFAVTLDFTPRAPGDVGPDGDTTTLFTFTATSSNTPVSFAWDFDSDGVDDLTTATPTATHTYPVHGSYLPRVTVTDIWGNVQDAVPENGSGEDVWLDVSPAAPTATLNGWGPYEVSGPDGNKLTEFTFSASATAAGGILRLEWDFNGDGTVDATTPVDGAPASVTNLTVTHTYGADGNYTPKVRVVDATGQESAWDIFNDGSTTPVLDVVTPGPVATMLQWSPFASSGPDGNTSTLFTLTAGATSGVGIDKLEWDLDGDGAVDGTSEFAGQLSVSDIAVTKTYTTAGSYTPKVRAIDMDGNASAWDEYNQGTSVPTLDVDDVVVNGTPEADAGADQLVLVGSAVTLDGSGSTDPDLGDSIVEYLWSQVSGPETMSLNNANPVMPTFTATTVGTFVFELRVTDSHGTQSPADSVTVTVVNSATSAVMNQWSPYNPSGPDGQANTSFTFSADATTAVGVLKLEWDLDGDGTVDATTDITGAPLTVTGVTTTHTYGADGTYTPQVRVVQVGGATSAWDPYNVDATIIQLDVFTEQVPGDTYCNDMTIDQLIASGQYNVIDKRNSSQRIIFGTSNADLILGNGLDNWIDGRGGNDCIIAFEGNDEVYDFKGSASTGGTDWLFGGDGNDKLYALNGDDYVFGGNGNDYLEGHNGNDRLYGGAGDDIIKDISGNDYIDGGDGTDNCIDTSGTNTIINCETLPPAEDAYCDNMTIDQLIASGQYNVIDFRNATGKKTINGTDGKDLILGGKYNDNINAKKGDDCVIAGDGNDTVNAQDGNDTVYGGKGNDTIHGQNGNDSLYGGDGNDTIYGSNGDDKIYGGAGKDKLKGDNGSDYIDGGSQADECEGGNGSDQVINCEDDDDHNDNDDDDHNGSNGNGNGNGNHDDDDDDDHGNNGNHNGNSNGNGNGNRRR